MAKQKLLRQAEQQTGLLRLGADLLVGSALYPEARRRDAERKRLRDVFSVQMDALKTVHQGDFTAKGQQPTLDALKQLRQTADHLLAGHETFHWPLEFPEVFVEPAERDESPEFNAIVGNPPFMGGTIVSSNLGQRYFSYFKMHYQNFGDRVDLCAAFMIRMMVLVRAAGSVGVIATGSISRGDTKKAGLDSVIERGGSICYADPSRPWPGNPTIDVALIHLWNVKWNGPVYLRNTMVSHLSTSLDTFSNLTPLRLSCKNNSGENGSKLDGDGFILSSDEAKMLIDEDPIAADVIRPFLSGNDIATNLDGGPSRWVIDFGNRSLVEASQYMVWLQLIKDRVYPGRQKHAEARTREHWWLF